jgi:prepilin-type N-terminal cleavage/methylation domain-containing protein
MRRVRKGFTLIELLIVVVIIGILAAIAIPKFANTKEKAYLATMKGDLRNLATAQEGYASDNSGAYMPAGAVTGPASSNGYAPTSAVTVTIANAGAGWSATATHAQAPGKTCSIYVNIAAGDPAGIATADGEPKCN